MNIPNVDIVASSSGTLRPEHCSGVFAKPIERAVLPAVALALDRTLRIRKFTSYFIRGDVQARSAVQARQRAEGA
jgi:hypothetical protein